MVFIKNILILVGVVLLMSACGEKDRKEEILKKSTNAAVEFMKAEDVTLVNTEAEITSAIGGGTVFVRGEDMNTGESYTVNVFYEYEEDSYIADSYGYGVMGMIVK
ncbi:hypothetical protein [Bacillus massiliglaciei]|uniref:hypothetical protein n=1 Tax=Bacillus massiliglaciei TaxID=1816693 RepID=UPI000DA638DF|nr:hypothetical protein [Bacillus massiliglaciei]